MHFMTRIELNGSPTRQDYENLHAAMKRAGFSRFIRASDGTAYHLPHAEYSRIADLTLDQVRAQAHASANTVWTSVQTLTTQGLSGWVGLREATASEIAAA